jgi:hypothetical protein
MMVMALSQLSLRSYMKTINDGILLLQGSDILRLLLFLAFKAGKLYKNGGPESGKKRLIKFQNKLVVEVLMFTSYVKII